MKCMPAAAESTHRISAGLTSQRQVSALKSKVVSAASSSAVHTIINSPLGPCSSGRA